MTSHCQNCREVTGETIETRKQLSLRICPQLIYGICSMSSQSLILVASWQITQYTYFPNDGNWSTGHQPMKPVSRVLTHEVNQ